MDSHAHLREENLLGGKAMKCGTLGGENVTLVSNVHDG